VVCSFFRPLSAEHGSLYTSRHISTFISTDQSGIFLVNKLLNTHAQYSTFSIPNTPSPVRGYHDFLTFLHPLRSVPQIKINQHTTHGHVYPMLRGGRGVSDLLILASEGEDLVSNSFYRNDTRSPDAHFFLGSVFKVVSRFEEGEEGRWVCEDFEVVEDLWDAVVGEHGYVVNASTWEYGVGYLWCGGEERGPCLCYQDLGSLEEVD